MTQPSRNMPTPGVFASTLVSRSANFGSGFATHCTPRFVWSWLHVASTHSLCGPSALYVIWSCFGPPFASYRAFAAAGSYLHASPHVSGRYPGSTGDTNERADDCVSEKIVLMIASRSMAIEIALRTFGFA